MSKATLEHKQGDCPLMPAKSMAPSKNFPRKPPMEGGGPDPLILAMV